MWCLPSVVVFESEFGSSLNVRNRRVSLIMGDFDFFIQIYFDFARPLRIKGCREKGPVGFNHINPM